MGLVTDVFWNCPGCGSRENAQVYGTWDDPDEFPVDAVPSTTELKWNPPCTKCGKYKLTMPKVMIKCEAVPVTEPEESDL